MVGLARVKVRQVWTSHTTAPLSAPQTFTQSCCNAPHIWQVMCKSRISSIMGTCLYFAALCLIFLVHPIIAYIYTSHGPFAWYDGTKIKPSNTEAEKRHLSFHLSTALLNITIHMSLTSPNHSCLFLLLPLFLLPLSPSIRQTWRSSWSMCSIGTLKRFQGSWKKAWTPTSMIQTREVRQSVLSNIPFLQCSN